MNRTLMNTFSPPLKATLRKVRGPFDARLLKKLEAREDGVSRKAGRAIREAVGRNAAAEDVVHLEHIERQRGEWLENRGSFLSHADWEGEVGEHDREQSMREVALASKDSLRAGFLYQVVRQFRPRTALELGTNVGVSAAYQALAQRHAGESPAFHTFDMSGARQRLARELHEQLPLPFVHYHLGRFEETLAGVLEEVEGVDYAFVDGHHLYEPSKRYTDWILRRAKAGTVLVFDDIRWNREMVRFWREIRRDPRFELVVDAFTLGMAVVAPEGNTAPPFVSGPYFYFFANPCGD